MEPATGSSSSRLRYQLPDADAPPSCCCKACAGIRRDSICPAAFASSGNSPANSGAQRQALLRVVDPIQGRRVVGQRPPRAGLSHSSGVRD